MGTFLSLSHLKKSKLDSVLLIGVLKVVPLHGSSDSYLETDGGRKGDYHPRKKKEVPTVVLPLVTYNTLNRLQHRPLPHIVTCPL